MVDPNPTHRPLLPALTGFLEKAATELFLELPLYTTLTKDRIDPIRDRMLATGSSQTFCFQDLLDASLYGL